MNIDINRSTDESKAEKSFQSDFDPDKRNTLEINKGSEKDNGGYDPDKRIENNDGFYSTYKERIDQVPKRNGQWTGEPGESKFIPDALSAKETLGQKGLDGINYENGLPDFSPVAVAKVEIENMTEHRHSVRDEDGNKITGNYEKANNALAEQWNKENKNGKNDWTYKDVERYRKDMKYTWHEDADRKTCYLVPYAVHKACKHSGGAFECKKRDNSNIGGGFDA